MTPACLFVLEGPRFGVFVLSRYPRRKPQDRPQWRQAVRLFQDDFLFLCVLRVCAMMLLLLLLLLF